MEARLHQRLEQRMRLSQQMLQNLEMLQMPAMELRELIVQELQENPVLELKEDIEERPTEEREAAEAEAPAEEPPNDVLEAAEEQWAETERSSYRRSSGDGEDRFDMLQTAAAPSISLKEHLNEQLHAMGPSEEMRRFAEHIIESLDDKGFLAIPLQELTQSLPDPLRSESPEILQTKLESALALVQKFDPKGVGARNTQECLLLQLDPSDEIYPLLRFLIEHHLEDISHNRIPRLAKALLEHPQMRAHLGYEAEPDMNDVYADVKTLIAELSRLHLHPAADFTTERAPAVHPEVVIKEIDGKYEIMLEDSYLPPISVNRAYLEMLQNKTISKDERSFIRNKMDAGKRLISAIEQRRGTIQRIAEQLLARQMEFFEQGLEHLKPLKMQEVADALGIHVSTVSRAISDKYVETPRGIFPLKFFFPSSAAPKRDTHVYSAYPQAAPANDADPQTRHAVKSQIQEILSTEDPKKPLSDLEIVKLLKDRGTVTARRTVAKYREELGIQSSRLRQQY